MFIHTSGLLRAALAGETLPRWRRLSLEGDVACEERSPLCRTGLDSKGENNTTPLVHNVTRTAGRWGLVAEQGITHVSSPVPLGVIAVVEMDAMRGCLVWGGEEQMGPGWKTGF